ncbi:MAG TPA: NADH-quinone oxidoreductase subunit D, partial [Bryobacteraceae bacterium]|nr:NADH-quinone oxidoreductase subunit D [Bryobacteraceae bacterium]
FFYCFRERENILRLFEMFSGQRMMTSYFRIGGLALDAPRGWQQAVGKFIRAFPKSIEQYEKLLNANPIWMERTKGVAVMPLEEMLNLGVTGPMIRAAGLPWDIRKDEPYSSYNEFDFKVPTRTESDVYARFQVRVDELRESTKIVIQALEGMPEGPFQCEAPGIVLPEREAMKTQMEALIYHFKIITEGFRVPPGDVYVPVESPRGELGYYVVSDGSTNPYRVFMRTPSFGNLIALGPMLKDMLLADSIAGLGSMDFVLGDTDR